MVISINIVPLEAKPYRIKGVALEDIRDAVRTEFAIVEKGTVGGQTTLIMVMHDRDGFAHIAEFTGNQFEGLVTAFRIAKERFGK